MERKISITNTTIMKFLEEKKELQKKLNPIVKRIEQKVKPLDPYYEQIRQLNEKIKSLKEEMKPFEQEYQIEAKKAETIDAQAQAIDNKLKPLIADELKNIELGEFEEAREVNLDKGMIIIKIVDRIEEFKNSLRLRKAQVK